MPVSRGDVEFSQQSWTFLTYQFTPNELQALSDLDPHISRGQRLTDMYLLASRLPDGFKSELSFMGFNPAPLRAVGFSKSRNTNWSLPWHQDRVIAMPRKTDAPEFRNWSRKSGVWHCEPSAEILAEIAFAYIAFDDIDAEASGLELAEGTHRFGPVPEKEIDRIVQNATKARPEILKGQALLVSALTLHRSAPMKTDGTRRTLRIDFGTAALNLSK